MYSVRIHGRGGQGVVTAAELLSVAAHAGGRYAQAFPSFGSERTGAPVMAFCRVDDRPIRLREPVLTPDALVVQDPTLLRAPGVFTGLAPDGSVVVNAAVARERLPLPPAVAALDREHLVVLPATALALSHIGRPVPNVALLGALAALTGLVPFEAMAAAIRERFPGKVAEGNVAAAHAAFDLVRQALPAGAGRERSDD
ncbi:pyruvate ferredoxin oxidoreductase subunit gamma [Virgisporangium aliadipatigenens]|uniref:Pyruvate ferredoxin oxidoreductase subunit gamma n=1 Tax=Virgisporangium aliadipatigenens TaxID=741659 RepID=A0A8J4DTB6_9ACTN|nr:2-oxoacid:acceptor oxidoreductase family protein [Virgisporangium aliadipatigenens]GIJ48087.1 pyruvate ferredoxin oxidoreductase subunit gamma [Virgisporangium aliadipatigenens]